MGRSAAIPAPAEDLPKATRDHGPRCRCSACERERAEFEAALDELDEFVISRGGALIF
jgi:hypothetical protein